MASPRIAIAAGDRLGVGAAERIARDGGNALDALLAAAVMAWVAEPFFTSLAGSGFITVRSPDGVTKVYDGNTAMPHSAPEEPGQGTTRVFLDYSNGIHTFIGGGAVAVPGILAAMYQAWDRHGQIEWAALFQPAIEAARSGLAFPSPSAFYLTVTWQPTWSRYDEARTLFAPEGAPLVTGERFVQAALADTLEAIANEGPDALYRGWLGVAIAEAIAADGGWMTVEDLGTYKAEIRSPLRSEPFGWKVDTNPPPAVGGAVLAHMLALLADASLEDPLERTSALVEAQRAAMGFRHERYQDPDGIAAAFQDAIASMRARSGETTHASSAGADGLACALTQSAGYGAGLIVEGVLLNNSLGEEELNPMGTHALPPGARCHSNMTPTIASGDGITVALGSPGADRIVSAIAQTIVRIAIDGASLAEAIAAPRVHLDMRPGGDLLCYEPGLPGDALGYDPRPFDRLNIYFGGVQAASVDEEGELAAAHDPRRAGASLLV